MNQNVLRLGAVLSTEKMQKNYFNECSSFVAIVLKTTDLKNIIVSGRKVSLTGNKFQILVEKSHRDWEKIFKCKNHGGKLTIEVPDGYIPGIPI